jgi:hypothetical protein
MRNKKNFSLLGAVLIIGGALFAFDGFAQTSMNAGGPPQGGVPILKEGGVGMKNFTPSAESITACADSSEAATCLFTFTDNGSNNSLSGTCRKNPKNDDQLVCMPKAKNQGEFRGKMNSISGEAIKACNGKDETASCSFMRTNGETAISGICKKNSKDGSELSCVSGVGEGGNSPSKAKKIKELKATQIFKMEKRIEKIITFIASKGINTDEVENNFSTFKEKTDAVLLAIDAYISALGASDDAITAAREDVKSATKTMTDYFNGTLRKSIESALAELD